MTPERRWQQLWNELGAEYDKLAATLAQADENGSTREVSDAEIRLIQMSGLFGTIQRLGPAGWEGAEMTAEERWKQLCEEIGDEYCELGDDLKDAIKGGISEEIFETQTKISQIGAVFKILKKMEQ